MVKGDIVVDINDKIADMVKRGMSYNQVAKECGVSINVVAGVMHRYRAPIREFRDDIKKMASDGMSANEIAKKLSVGRQSVVNFCNNEGFNLVNGYDKKNSIQNKVDNENAKKLADLVVGESVPLRKAAKSIGISWPKAKALQSIHGIDGGRNFKKYQAIAIFALIMKKIDNSRMSDVAKFLSLSNQRINGALTECGLSMDAVDFDGSIEFDTLLDVVKSDWS